MTADADFERQLLSIIKTYIQVADIKKHNLIYEVIFLVRDQ